MVRRIIALFSLFLFLLHSDNSAQEKKAYKYVGVTPCAPCHRGAAKGSQFEIWQKSRHSKAYQTLQTKKADSLAKAKGLKVKASEAPECLKCHVTAVDLPATRKLASFKTGDGVQCETCHGAGSEYRPMAVMKDRAKSVAAGLVTWKDEKAIAQFCQSCHNEKSPTFKAFKFQEMWGKIKHPAPKKG